MDLQTVLAALRGGGQPTGQPAPPAGAGMAPGATPQPQGQPPQMGAMARGGAELAGLGMAYRKYAADAQIAGEPAMPFEQWAAMQQSGGAPTGAY